MVLASAARDLVDAPAAQSRDFRNLRMGPALGESLSHELVAGREVLGVAVDFALRASALGKVKGF